MHNILYINNIHQLTNALIMGMSQVYYTRDACVWDLNFIVLKHKDMK